jgi:formylglycine-generating enzyme required for sulfatase activity
MKNIILPVLATTIGVCATASVPVVKPGSVTFTQSASRLVTIGYELQNEAAVVTIDIQTNGVSIGAANTRGMYGDVHVKVEPGPDKKAYWAPVKSWPDKVVSDGSMTAVVKAWATNAPPEWMVVNLDRTYEGRADAVKYYTSLEQSPDGGDISSEVYKTSRIVLKRIPAGGVPFFMGAHPKELGYQATKELLHRVMLSSDYYIGVYEITQGQYGKIYSMPNKFYFMKEGACRPVEYLTWNNIRGETSYWPGTSCADGYGSVADASFLGSLRKFVGGAVMFDLPTEAQWEFACRAGTQTGLYTGLDISNSSPCENLNPIARYKGNCNGGNDINELGNTTAGPDTATALAGTYKSNNFGLYDMLGNVREFCLDWYDETANYGRDAIDPVGPVNNASDALCACRGGSYVDSPNGCRSSSRFSQKRNQNSRATGFRICVPLNY